MSTTEMTSFDHAVTTYTNTRWDTIDSALRDNGLDWRVDVVGLQANGVDVDNHYALVRTDTNQTLGIVSGRYKTVQNQDVANLMAETGCTEYNAVHLGGRAGRILLVGKAKTFSVGEADPVDIYINMMFGHDGKTPVSFFPSSHRAMCQNMAPTMISDAKAANSFFTFKHIGDVDTRISQLQEALSKHREATDRYINATEYLRRSEVKDAVIASFYAGAYHQLFGTPKEETEDLQAARQNVINVWNNTLQEEMTTLDVSTPNMWLVFNSVTRNMQRLVPARGKKITTGNKIFSLVGGKDASDTSSLFDLALSV